MFCYHARQNQYLHEITYLRNEKQPKEHVYADIPADVRGQNFSQALEILEKKQARGKGYQQWVPSL